MTANEFDTFLKAAVIVFCLMGVGNLFLYKRRGPGAYALAVACLLAAGSVLIFQQQGMGTGVYACAGLVFVALVVDFTLRAGRETPRKPR